MRSWFVVAALLIVFISPAMMQTPVLEDTGDNLQFSSPIQSTSSPNSSWTSGGEAITITGSGFSDLAFSNITDDGINHQWVKTNMDYSDEAGRWNAVAMDSNGHIHVVHIGDENYKIRHSVHDGTSWNTLKIKDCGQTYCWDVHMVIDGNDHLHAAYTTYTQWAERLVYMNYDGTNWTSEEVSSNALFGPVGIAVDSNNNPHISYAAEGSHQCGGGLRIASHDGTDWSTQGIDLGSNRGCDSAIVIDENDDIYIAYQDRDSSKLKIATDKSGQWDDYTVNTGSYPSEMYPGYMSSIAMDGQGQIHIAHHDSKDEDLKYSTGVPNGQWTTTVVDSSGNTGRDPSIVIDLADQPHIVYHTWSGQNLKYATIDPVTTNWAVTTMASGADVGEGNSIIIDESGVMHVPFNDATSKILKYATKSTGLSKTNEITVQFGQYGSVTGTVVNDSTIQVTTPSASSAGTVILTLWDKEDNQHQLSSSFRFIDQNDLDSDGVLNANDDCPEVAGTSTQDLTGCPDADGDGYSDSGDTFPNDVLEWMDFDGDGVGDNGDAFPNDANETQDSDGDGVGDNADLYPFNANEWEDLDGNQIPDNSEASKVEVTTSSEGGKIHPYHIFANNLSFSVNAITSEGLTMVSLESSPDVLPSTGGLAYSFYGGESQTISIAGEQIMDIIPEEFFTGGYIDDVSPFVNFTLHVTGIPNGCEGAQEWWSLEQQATCPSKIESHRTDYVLNFSMILWNGDDDNDGVSNSWDLFPLDANENQDSDGDGVGDNRDVFPLESTQWSDTDGDGYGDNWGNTSWNSTRSSSSPGSFVEEANAPDYCPELTGNSTADGFYGCLDDDGDGVADVFEPVETNETGQTNSTDETNQTDSPIDTDQDGVLDMDDNCPGTAPDSQVDAFGCEVIEEENDEVSASIFEEFFSGDTSPVTTTVGIGAILLALFTLLQSNAVAGVLPDTFRWVQVLRNNSKLSKEEENELTYLQSLVQAYYDDSEELVDELNLLKADLTGRYTNNEIKKDTREKLFTLIDDLLIASPQELYRIAHNDSYFGLAGAVDSEDRSKLLEEKLAMSDFSEPSLASDPALQSSQPEDVSKPSIDTIGLMKDDGFEWYESPEGSGVWWYRTAHANQDWRKWQS